MAARGLAARAGPILLLILVNLNFSGYAVLASLAFRASSLSPVVFALLRDAVASACFAAALCATAARVPADERGPLVPTREHAALFGALGLIGVFSSMFGALAISLTSGVVYGLMTPLVPCITLIVSFALGLEVFKPQEGASWVKAAGIALAVGGAVSIVALDVGGGHGGAGTLGGYMYLIAQKTGIATYPILQKRMLQTLPYASLTLAAWAYFCGGALVLLNATTSATTATAWAVTPVGAGAVLFSGVFAAFFNYAAMAWVNARLGPVLVMSFYPLQSVLTPLLSAALLGTTVRRETAAGGAAIVAGLFCVLWAKHAEGDAPATGVVEADATADAATVVLSRADVDALVSAASAGGDAAAAAAVIPMIERSFSRAAGLGGAVAGEDTALLARGGALRARAASAAALGIGAHRRVARERSVAVAVL